eukprot:TRINITY_DN856_c0_g1_i2.p1 TRINITY_DN856_c0_g1~~TRINITY_DN856_c0_g1_i2.p1  ORF type:complete len:464 (-),score=95.95 TRINITY_DN856_c0_g1_i2:71-1462(-)
MGSNLSQQAKDRIFTSKKSGKQELNLQDCDLLLFPPEIKGFKGLKKLNISRNTLTFIPPQIKKFPLLTYLDANTNEIASVPVELGILHDLLHLDLSHNLLSSINSLPTNLTLLNISFNLIDKVGNELQQLSSLTELNLKRNKISIFPTQILSLRNLTALNIGGNTLNYLPDEIDQLSKLEVLDISDNSFSALPANLFKLFNLRQLNLSKNPIGDIPPEIELLSKLQILQADKCRLTQLNFDITRVPELVELTLSENHLKMLPRNMCLGLEKLVNLRILDLSNNALEAIPRQVGYILSLRKLILNNNSIRTIPGEFHLLNPSLDLSLSSNPLDYPFSKYLEDGVPVLLDSIDSYMKAYPPNTILVEDVSEVSAGVPAYCIIISYDFLNKPKKYGGDVFDSKAISEEDPTIRADAFVKANKETPGRYDLFFNIPRPGKYLLHITTEGQHIKGSPFSVHCLPKGDS